MRKPKTIAASPSFTHERLLETKYYSMDRVIIPEQGKKFMAVFDTFRHIFVRSGSVVFDRLPYTYGDNRPFGICARCMF